MIDSFVNGYESVDYKTSVDGSNLVLYVYLAGTNKQDVSVKVDNSVLVVRAKNKIGYDKWEYSKRWQLPDSANVSRISSNMVDGVLKVVIPTVNSSRSIDVE